MADEDATPPTPTVLEWFVEALGEDVEFATNCNLEATALFMNFIGATNPYEVPAVIVSRCILEVGADLYYRKSSRNGIVEFGGGDGMPSIEPVRLNRDPMAAAYAIVRPFLPAPGL